jgi:peptidoglycan/LPS O-acetylase OafA/YrhL
VAADGATPDEADRGIDATTPVTGEVVALTPSAVVVAPARRDRGHSPEAAVAGAVTLREQRSGVGGLRLGEQETHNHFRPDIEGLRAVAVLAVVLFHAGLPFLPGGFVGVDVFFVISGFLITGMLWRETSASGTVSLRKFWAARARRLLPASALVGVVTIVASALLLPPLQVKTVSIDAITSALYVSNYWFAITGINYFGKDSLLSPSPFQHYWSLGVEEQFYLVWPLLILFIGWVVRRVRRGRSTGMSVAPYLAVLIGIAVLSFICSLVLTYVMPPVAYFSLPTRAWQLAMGGLVAFTVVWWRKLPAPLSTAAGWSGLAMIGLGCVWITGASPYPGLPALLPTVGAALVIGAGCASAARGAGQLLGTAPMRWIGRVSYSWYLWHWPVLVLAPALLGHRLSIWSASSAVLLSLALAVLTLRYVENPVRFADRLRTSPRNSLLTGAAATMAAVLSAVAILLTTQTPAGRGAEAAPLSVTVTPLPQGSPLRAYDDAIDRAFAQVKVAVEEALTISEVPPNLTPTLDGQVAEMRSMQSGGCLRVAPLDSSPHPDCVSGNPDAPVTVALVGDSHAAMYNPTFEKLTAERNWRLIRMAKVACPILDLPSSKHFNSLSEELSRCAHWRKGVLDRLRAERPDLVAISSARSYGGDGLGIWGQAGFDHFDSDWVGGLERFTAEMRAQGTQVLLLSPVPGSASLVPLCLSGHMDDPLACSYPIPPWASSAGRSKERAAVEAGGGQYLDTVPLFCARDRCPVIIGNSMVYYDANHLSRSYALALAPAIGAVVDRALALR